MRMQNYLMRFTLFACLLGKPLVADNNIVAADGYTLLEHYLNWLAAPHAFVSTNATDIDLWPYTLGFTNGATYAFASLTNCSITLTNGHFAHFIPNHGFTGLASFSFSVTDPDGSSMTNTMGVLVSIIYIPKNLVWAATAEQHLGHDQHARLVQRQRPHHVQQQRQCDL